MLVSDPAIRTLARKAGAAIHEAFNDYHSEFKAITRRAQQRFERCEWANWQDDATERLDLREQVLRRLTGGLHVVLADAR